MVLSGIFLYFFMYFFLPLFFPVIILLFPVKIYGTATAQVRFCTTCLLFVSLYRFGEHPMYFLNAFEK